MSARLRTRIERLERKRPVPELRPRLILIQGVKPGDLDKPLAWIEIQGGHRFEREADETEDAFRARAKRAVPPGRVWIGSGG